MMFHDVAEYRYAINNDRSSILSKIYLKNSGSNSYLIWMYDYFEFNSNNQIQLYRPIFDSGAATYELLGFDIAARCADAREKANQA